MDLQEFYAEGQRDSLSLWRERKEWDSKSVGLNSLPEDFCDEEVISVFRGKFRHYWREMVGKDLFLCSSEDTK